MNEQNILFKTWGPLIWDWDPLTLSWDPLSSFWVGPRTHLLKFINETLDNSTERLEACQNSPPFCFVFAEVAHDRADDVYTLFAAYQVRHIGCCHTCINQHTGVVG